jgi:hypothetical protein
MLNVGTCRMASRMVRNAHSALGAHAIRDPPSYPAG